MQLPYLPDHMRIGDGRTVRVRPGLVVTKVAPAGITEFTPAAMPRESSMMAGSSQAPRHLWGDQGESPDAA